jgi:serine/threonine protein kinase
VPRQISRPRLSDGTWCYSRRARADDPTQGWKLHVSATIFSAEEIFQRALPVLRQSDALFKVPCRLELLASLNSGIPDFSQVGKFLTVYPRSDEEAVKLARDLHRVTRGLAAPQVPFDAQYRRHSLVYYRYGAFRGANEKGGLIQRPDGRWVADKRAPGRAVPSWIADPFNRRKETRRQSGPLGTDFLAFKTKMQRGKGGVYEGIDLSVSPPRLVIIKEGRRHGEVDREGRDGYARVRHEAKVLRRLQKVFVPVPRIFREFSQDGNRYLALEKVAGRPLMAANRLQPGKVSWGRAATILEHLGPILSAIHAAGWVWRDCKPSHIFIHRGRWRLIDFENACRLNHRKIASWKSPHYLPPTTTKSFRRRPGAGEDDYALGVIVFQFGTGKFPPIEARRREAIYRATRCPVGLRKRIEMLLGSKTRQRCVK